MRERIKLPANPQESEHNAVLREIDHLWCRVERSLDGPFHAQSYKGLLKKMRLVEKHLSRLADQLLRYGDA